MRGRWAENARVPVIMPPLAWSITPPISQLTKTSRRLDVIKPKACLLLEQARAQTVIDEEPKSSRGPQKRSERQVGRERTCTCHNATFACSITPTLRRPTKISQRLDMIKPKARLLLEQARAQTIIMTNTRERSFPPTPPPWRKLLSLSSLV